MNSFAEKRTEYMRRWGSLTLERSSWITHWQELSEFILPRSGRFLITDHNDGAKRHNSIYNSTATRAIRILQAGLMSGMTSPARPWFRLAPADLDLVENESVRDWLERAGRIMREVFARSNTYRALPMIYEELGVFGTGVSLVEPNFENVIHHHPLTAGEYCLALDEYGSPNTLYREFEMTTSQLIEKFGEENVSQHVKNLHTSSKVRDVWVPVMHVIQPNGDYDVRKRIKTKMPFTSCYFEKNSHEDRLLREGGYKRFPSLAARWDAKGGDIYGQAPGMEALGDVKQLQHNEFRADQAIDYMALPPVALPTSSKGKDVDMLPGGVSYIDSIGAGQGARSLFDVRMDISHLDAKTQRIERRIHEAFYADLFLMLTLDNSGRELTAREVAERHEEKLLMLGPVLERLHNEALKPLIDITFEHIVEAGLLPPAPEELSGAELNVEFVSVLAQAQRAVGIGAIDRFVMTLGTLQPFKPDVFDKVDGDQVADEVADMLGVDPKLVVSDEKVALVRKDRAAAQAAQQQAALAEQAASAAQKLGSVKTSEPNAFTDLTSGQFSGYSGPTPGAAPRPPGL